MILSYPERKLHEDIECYIPRVHAYGAYLRKLAPAIKGTIQQPELECLYDRVQRDSRDYLNR